MHKFNKHMAFFGGKIRLAWSNVQSVATMYTYGYIYILAIKALSRSDMCIYIYMFSDMNIYIHKSADVRSEVEHRPVLFAYRRGVYSIFDRVQHHYGTCGEFSPGNSVF